MRRLSLYVHIPFCVTKCAYCDFNSYAGMDAAVDTFVEACEAEIAACSYAGAVAPTVFFGGGTPTYLSGEQLGRILCALSDRFTFTADCEITSEANPGTVDAVKFAAMRAAGFNRLSIGVQSFDDDELRRLDRVHTGVEAGKAFAAARDAGFTNVNLDFIFALPEQTRRGWARNLRRAFELSPEHLSLYGLTIEPNTPFYRMHRRGKLKLPTEEDEIWMFEHAMTAAQAAGYHRYEISNYCRPGRECRHNLVYWRNDEYVGFGPGAASYVDGVRWTNIKHPLEYNRRALGGELLAFDSEHLEGRDSVAETIMLGLRLTSGISLSALEQRYELDVRARLSESIESLSARSLIEFDGDTLRLSRAGVMVANDVSMELMDAARGGVAQPVTPHGL